MTETILCVKDSLLSLIPQERIVDVSGVRELIERMQPWFLPRPHAEGSPEWRQIIPYVMLEHNGKFACAKRVEGDPRLIGQFAIGFCGHINTTDIRHDGQYVDVARTVAQGTIREINEELDGVSCLRSNRRRVGIIYSDHSQVERVHIGFVELWTLESPEVTLRENSAKQLEWHTLEDLTAFPLEHWSVLCVQWLRKNWSCVRPRVSE